MFRPFFTTKARGTGLGLALVQKIVVTHNGRVSAANADGGGAGLTVTLPASARLIALSPELSTTRVSELLSARRKLQVRSAHAFVDSPLAKPHLNP